MLVVHPQPLRVVTVTLPEPPEEEKVPVDGEIEYEHPLLFGEVGWLGVFEPPHD